MPDMIVTKDVWNTYNAAQKEDVATRCLDELFKIDHKQHPLSGTPEQGRLCDRKKQLEQFVLSTIDWEEEKEL